VDLAELGSVQFNLILLYSSLVWQLPIIKHKINFHLISHLTMMMMVMYMLIPDLIFLHYMVIFQMSRVSLQLFCMRTFGHRFLWAKYYHIIQPVNSINALIPIRENHPLASSFFIYCQKADMIYNYTQHFTAIKHYHCVS